jgi:tetratricopeptide (TPR) repeat protein
MPRRTATSMKSKRDRKREKRRDYQVRARERQQREVFAKMALRLSDLRLVREPATPPDEAAAALSRLFEQRALGPELLADLLGGVESERARAVAAAAMAAGPSPLAFALAADIAFAAGDLDQADAHLARAHDLGELPVVSIRQSRVLAARGRIADAAAQLGAALAEDSDHPHAQLFRGELLEQLAGWEAQPASSCPCGSGRLYVACCQEMARRLLAEFTDRSPLYELRRALTAFVERHGLLVRIVRDSLDEWTTAGAFFQDEADENEELLILERALTTPIRREDGPTAMDLYAGDGEAEPELARVAQEWANTVTFGLWQVTALGNPGTLLTNYMSGTKIYAYLPPEQRERVRPWAVLLGCVGVLRGCWHAGPAFYEISPAEARALALPLARIVDEVATTVTSPGGPAREVVAWATQTREKLEDGSWLPENSAGQPPSFGTSSSMMRTALPGLVGRLRQMRNAPIGLANTEGDEIELVEARLTVADPKNARVAMAVHPDFEEEPDCVRWLGQELTPGQREQSLAMARAEGLEIDEDSGPSRWHRATLEWDGDELKVEVNSRRRLELLLEALAELGHPATVLDEQVTDLPADLLQGAAQPVPIETTRHERAATMDEAWRRSIPDEPLPALDGLTPRQAAEREDYADRLEAFTREMEYRLGERLPELRELAAVCYRRVWMGTKRSVSAAHIVDGETRRIGG